MSNTHFKENKDILITSFNDLRGQALEFRSNPEVINVITLEIKIYLS